MPEEMRHPSTPSPSPLNAKLASKFGIDTTMFDFYDWGVELGKKQAIALLPVITDDTSPAQQTDSSADTLVRYYRNARGRAR